MAGLVAYGSSDEEDETQEVIQTPPAKLQVNIHSSTVLVPGHITDSIDPRWLRKPQIRIAMQMGKLQVRLGDYQVF